MAVMESQKSGAWQAWHSDDVPLVLGVSGCMLGAEIRFDGGHARDRFVTDNLGPWVEWVSVCPEVEVGMGTPRPAIRLIEKEAAEGIQPADQGDKTPFDPASVRLVAPSTGADHTDSMQAFVKQRVHDLERVDGYVFKKSSPTCGLFRIKVYRENGHSAHTRGRGLWAAEVTKQWPLLPVEEDGRLNDARLRESFIERVFCRNRWRVLVSRGLGRKELVAFHTAHKLILRANNEAGYQALGKIVGTLGQRPDSEAFVEYEELFHRTMMAMASRGRHVNVLQHAMGYLKDQLGPREKREVMTAIEDYGAGLLPLIVPVTLLRMAVVHYEVEYLAGQLYFEPHPKELMLRNHV